MQAQAKDDTRQQEAKHDDNGNGFERDTVRGAKESLTEGHSQGGLPPGDTRQL